MPDLQAQDVHFHCTINARKASKNGAPTCLLHKYKHPASGSNHSSIAASHNVSHSVSHSCSCESLSAANAAASLELHFIPDDSTGEEEKVGTWCTKKARRASSSYVSCMCKFARMQACLHTHDKHTHMQQLEVICVHTLVHTQHSSDPHK